MNTQDKKQYEELLELCTVLKSPDKDNRFMAAHDLQARFKDDKQNGKTVDPVIEKKICEAFIKHLEDISMDVQTNAIKCLQEVATLISDQNLQTIAESLVKMILDQGKTEDVRGIYLQAIQATIRELEEKNATGLIGKISPQLVKGLDNADEDVVEKCLEIMSAVFQKFHGTIFKRNDLMKKQVVIQKLCAQQIKGNVKLCKKTAVCMGYFSMSLNAQDLDTLVKNQMLRLQDKKSSKNVILASLDGISQIANLSGGKLTKQFETLFKLIKTYPDQLKKDANEDTQNEIVETALETIKNLLLKCSSQAQNHLEEIFDSAKQCLSYDPEYNYDNDQDQDQDGDGWDDEEGDGWGDEDDQEADDSTAWKVRKGAIKIINAIIVSCPVQLKQFWKQYLLLLNDRLKERDDNVKIEIMKAMQNLQQASITLDQDVKRTMFSVNFVRMRSYVDDIKGDFSSIVQNLIKQSESKNQDIRIEVIKTIAVLFKLMPRADAQQELENVLPLIIKSKKDDVESFEYNTKCLDVLKTAFKSIDPSEASYTAKEKSADVFNYLKRMLGHNSIKIQAQTLRVLGLFVLNLQDLAGNIDFENEAMVQPAYQIVYAKLEKEDMDQDVRFNSIITMAQLIKVAHGVLDQVLINNVMSIYRKRILVELTREPTLKAFRVLADNDEIIKLQGIAELIPELINLLHQNSRQVQVLTLEAILALISKYSEQFLSNANNLQTELAKLVSEEDQQRTDLAVAISASLIKLANAQANNSVVEAIVKYASKNTDQFSNAVKQIQNFLQSAAQAKIVGDETNQVLRAHVSLEHRSAAKMIATIVKTLNITKYVSTLNESIKGQISQAQESEGIKNILILGEIGALMDLSAVSNVVGSIHQLFKNENPKIRLAAAISLGDITIGNTQFFLSKVFAQIESAAQFQEKQMFLQTLKEIIFNNPNCLENQLQQLMNLYTVQAKNEDKQIRNIISESIGKLFVAHGFKIQKEIISALQKGDARQISTFARSFKFSAYSNYDKALFVPYADVLVSLIANSDLDVKVSALQALAQLAGNEELKIIFGKAHVDQMVNKTILETTIKKELISTVDLGAFKDVRDAGTPVRKEAFHLLEVMIEKFVFPVSPVCASFIQGIQDTDENIQVLSFKQVLKIFHQQPIIVVDQLDKLVESFKYVYSKCKINLKPGNETERALNVARAMFKLCKALQSNADSVNHIGFQEWFFTTIADSKDGAHIMEMYAQVTQ